MTETQLYRLIVGPRDSNVEFQSDDVTNLGLAKHLVAFLNYDGGTVLLGVDNDGRISGVKQEEREEWVAAACRNRIDPPVIPNLSWARNVEGGRDVLAIQVRSGPNKPYARIHQGRKTYYTRAGRTSREATRAEMQRIFQESGRLHYGLKPVLGTALSAFDMNRITNYFQRIRLGDVPTQNDLVGWKNKLYNTNLMTTHSSQTTATIDGLLLFGKDPYYYLPQSGIRAVCHFGVEPDYATIADEDLRGPIVPIVTNSGILELGLVEKAVSFVRANTRSRSRLIDGRNVSRWDYPEDVVRELVVNALVHRDYSIEGTDIMLAIYSDRLEVVSPGRLPNPVTIEGVTHGLRYARNQTLYDVMRDYGYIGRHGMGVARRVIPGMHAHNGTEPEFIARHQRFTVRLWKR